jgi:glycosyltransferase involved in cell wall biosynthesis
MKLTFCLLSFNEIDGCRHDVPLINRNAFDEIYAIDAGSTDGTLEYLASEGIPAYIQPDKGLNAACKYAFEKCTTNALVFFHPKGTVPVSDSEKFRAYFDDGYELVVASRSIEGAVNEEDEMLLKPRKWFVRMIAIIAALIWKGEGNIIWDVLHGFRGVTVAAFEKIKLLDTGLSMDLEIVIRAYKFRIKRIEFPTSESVRIGGETHFKALPTGWRLLKYMWFELWRKD